MPQEYEPISWLDPRCRIREDIPHDRIDAGPIKILHQKQAFTHTIEISPQKPGTPLGAPAQSTMFEISSIGLDIEICYAVTPYSDGRRAAFALRIGYGERFNTLIGEEFSDELPPCGEDSLDTGHDIA